MPSRLVALVLEGFRERREGDEYHTLLTLTQDEDPVAIPQMIHAAIVRGTVQSLSTVCNHTQRCLIPRVTVEMDFLLAADYGSRDSEVIN